MGLSKNVQSPPKTILAFLFSLAGISALGLLVDMLAFLAIKAPANLDIYLKLLFCAVWLLYGAYFIAAYKQPALTKARHNRIFPVSRNVLIFSLGYCTSLYFSSSSIASFVLSLYELAFIGLYLWYSLLIVASTHFSQLQKMAIPSGDPS